MRRIPLQVRFKGRGDLVCIPFSVFLKQGPSIIAQSEWPHRKRFCVENPIVGLRSWMEFRLHKARMGPTLGQDPPLRKKRKANIGELLPM